MADLKRFEYVLALSECKNFSQAAQQLDISQSTLSQYIQKIEKEIGVSLFDRSVSPLKLTQYGEIYVKGARKIVDAYSETLDSIGDADAGTIGSVRVGLSPSRASFMLPQVVSEFTQLYPQVTLKFIESKSKDIMKNLSEGNIDFAYTVTSGEDSYDDCRVISVDKERIMLVTSADVKLSDEEDKAVDFKLAEKHRFILLEENQLLTKIFHDLCKKSSASIENYICVSELSTALSLVKSGLGIMLLPSSYRNYGRLKSELSFYDIKQSDSERELAVIYKKDKYINKPTRALLEIMCR
ncbi:MAG: LysR family transcriptional regulator [Clostridia bacterium]|nr:LysR family transcriptional regulator [Clostridia bacterium]